MFHSKNIVKHTNFRYMVGLHEWRMMDLTLYLRDFDYIDIAFELQV